MTDRRLPPRPPLRAQAAGRALGAHGHRLREDAEGLSDERFLTLCAAAVLGADDDYCASLGLVVAADAIDRGDVAYLVGYAAELSREECGHLSAVDPACRVCRTTVARDRVATALRHDW